MIWLSTLALATILDRVRFGASLPIRLELLPERAPGPMGIPRLRLTLNVLDRQSGQPSRVVQEADCRVGREEDLLDLIRGLARALVAHEVDESLYIDGRRPFDPHAGDA